MPHRRRGAGARWRGTLLRVPLVVAAACWACTAPEPGPVSVQVAVHPAASVAKPAYVEVGGLSHADLTSLRDRPMTASEWSALLKIFVADAGPGLAEVGSGLGDVESGLGDVGSGFSRIDPPPEVLGRYAVTGSAVTFTPLYPLDPGRAYRVVFDPSHLPRRREAAPVTDVVRLPAVATAPTRVLAVHPSAGVVPENLLRLYIEFSGPMGNASGLDFVKLVELSGADGNTERTVAGAFLPVEADFWSPDHTRYTLFFDPGRVKDDILPNRESGRPLRAAGRYAIDIARSWTDANGRPLEAAFRHTFRAGPAVDEAIDIVEWTLEVPEAGTREALTVRFPRPLDHGIIVRALGVETGAGQRIDGKVAPGAHDAAWVFTPVAPWQGGEYNLVAQSFLEDPQGNQIGRAFEVSAGELDNRPVSGAEAPSRLAFAIRTAP